MVRLLFVPCVVGCLVALPPALCADDSAKTDGGPLPTATSEEAWELLPPVAMGEKELLPVWARTLARPLPSTTAAMLEMDWVQRRESTLDPRLRARVRWAAARANCCPYSQAVAREDLLALGGSDADLAAIKSGEGLSPIEASTFAFARQMSREAYAVTDDQVRELLEYYGPADLTALVLVLAYANFQDRFLHGLGLADQEESLPPLDVRFDWESLAQAPLSVPPRTAPEPPADAAEIPTTMDDAKWLDLPLADLRTQLDAQAERAPRIPIPSAEEVERQSPQGRSAAILWNRVTFGYQPKLAGAWGATVRRFRAESALDAGFRQSLFWVVTRSNQCFY